MLDVSLDDDIESYKESGIVVVSFLYCLIGLCLYNIWKAVWLSVMDLKLFTCIYSRLHWILAWPRVATTKVGAADMN